MLKVIVLGAALASAGCAALAIGGAAAGGYYVGKDERSAAQIAKDGSITTRIKSRLVADPYVRAFAVDVDTYENVVTLSGRVTSYVEREQAERIAAAVAGVASVRNELEVIEE